MKPSKIDIAGFLVLALVLGGGYMGVIQRQARQFNGLKERITALTAEGLAADGLEVVLNSEQRELDDMIAARGKLLARIVAVAEADVFLAHFGAQAEAGNVDVNLLRPREVVSQEYFNSLPIDVHLEGDFAAVYSMLRELEHGRWLATVEGLHVKNDPSEESCNVVMTIGLTVDGKQ